MSDAITLNLQRPDRPTGAGRGSPAQTGQCPGFLKGGFCLQPCIAECRDGICRKPGPTPHGAFPDKEDQLAVRDQCSFGGPERLRNALARD